VRPDREFLTELSPPPGPSSEEIVGSGGRPEPGGRAARQSRTAGHAGSRRSHRRRVAMRESASAAGSSGGAVDAGPAGGRPGRRGLDHGLPATTAIPALLAVAADPATHSPARVRCPGPWWDAPCAAAHPGGGSADRAAEVAELAGLEAILAEVDADGWPSSDRPASSSPPRACRWPGTRSRGAPSTSCECVRAERGGAPWRDRHL